MHADHRGHEPGPRFLAHDKHAEHAALDTVALPRRGDVDAIVVVADEQERRVDPGFLVVDGQGQPLVVEPGERAQ